MMSKMEGRYCTERAAVIINGWAGAIVIVCVVLCSFTSLYAAVITAASTITHSWPSTPRIVTYSDPNSLQDANKVPENFASGRCVSQTFTVPADNGFLLTGIVITGTGNTADSEIFTLHLFDITGGSTLPGSYTPATDGPDPNTDLFENCSFSSPANGESLVSFTFTGSDTVPLEPNHIYAFEIWGPSAATSNGPFLWFRGSSIVSTYTGGGGYECPYNRTDTNIPTGLGPSDLRNYRSQLAGSSRDCVLGIYGTPYNGKAYKPTPYSSETDVNLTPLLSWKAGQWAADINGHNVYFGTDFNEVNNADTNTAGIYLGNTTSPSYQIKTELTGTVYYWRVDELNDVNTPGYWKGDVWQFTTTNASLTPPPWLHVEGNRIKDPNGRIVVLRGVSLIDLGYTEETWGTKNVIDRITNKNDPNGNSPGWYTRIIRIPICPHNSSLYSGSPLTFDPNDVNDPENESLYGLLREVVNYCAQKEIYAIIDWHHMDNTYDRAADTNVFWGFIAPRFKDDSHVFFELFNEPMNMVGSDSQMWNSVRNDMQTWVNIIRNEANAPHNLILVGTPQYNQILSPVVSNPIVDGNTVYVSHLYPAHWLGLYTGGNNSYYLNNITACAAVYPVIMTEWGFCPPELGDPNFFGGTISDYGNPLKEFLETYGIGNTAWCVSNGVWASPMFDSNWQPLCGENEMGCFTKDWLYEKKDAEWIAGLTITKCTVNAGNTQANDANLLQDATDIKNIKDGFTASGTGFFPTSFGDINYIDVDIVSGDGNVIYSETIDFNDYNDVVLKHGKYNHSHKITKAAPKGAITSLKIDFTKDPQTFALTAKNINLTGLACPVELDFKMGGGFLGGEANEAIVNGPKTTIPTRLMRRYKDTLIVPPGKTKVTSKAKASSDSLSVTGEIAVEDIDATDPNLYALPVVISWSSADDTNSQTFTIPPGSFKIPKMGHLYKLNKNITPTVTPVAEPNSKVSGTIDLDKCTFALSITKADLSAVSGQTKFGIRFGDFNEVNDVNLAWKK